MTYNIYDKSAALGAPYELFKFKSALREYYYTNAAEPVTFEGNVYTVLNITRGTTEITSATSSAQTVNFVVPTNCDLFEDNGRALSPPDMTVEVYRFHRGTTGNKRRIVGTVTGHSSKNETYTLETKSTVQTQLNRKIASVYYNNLCNHELYDERCKVDPSGFTYTTSIVDIVGAEITVADDYHANGALAVGTLTIGNEKRVIVKNIDNVLFFAYPFILAKVGDTATIARGCDLSRATCVSVFDNIANYGGFATIPTENPALPDFAIINTTTENTKRQKTKVPFWDSISSVAG